jgi:TatA/E family protein of Tat protein translocase
MPSKPPGVIRVEFLVAKLARRAIELNCSVIRTSPQGVVAPTPQKHVPTFRTPFGHSAENQAVGVASITGVASMFGLGTAEIVVICVIALLLFGNKLPELARWAGKTVVEFKKEASSITKDLH